MDAVAPLSVLLVGLLGVAIVAVAVLRIVMIERRLHLAPVQVLPVAPPTPLAGTGLAA